MSIVMRDFEDNEALCQQLAQCIVAALEDALSLRKEATLAVSGGSTPRPLFAALSRSELDWSRVRITQVDERWVPEDNPDSNARLIRETLLQGRAAAACFDSMKVDIDDAFSAEAACEERLIAFGDAIDVVVLGMGEDGHTASFFPGAENLHDVLDPCGERLCLAVRPPVAPHDRMTLSLAAVLRSRQLYLHITGAKKLAVLQQALADNDAMRLPISAVCQRSDNPLETFYAPGS